MAQNQLTTGTNSGTQTSTQSPQASVGSGTSTAKSSSVQPGTATDLLNNQGGVSLRTTPLSIVPLGGQAQTQSQQTVEPVKQHINPALFGVSALLFVLAIGMFWATARTGKTTTN